jgi:hypothetical protein
MLKIIYKKAGTTFRNPTAISIQNQSSIGRLMIVNLSSRTATMNITSTIEPQSTAVHLLYFLIFPIELTLINYLSPSLIEN